MVSNMCHVAFEESEGLNSKDGHLSIDLSKLIGKEQKVYKKLVYQLDQTKTADPDNFLQLHCGRIACCAF